MITSFIDGRVRFRSEALKNPETLAEVEAVVRGLDGIQSVISNPRTGSLLVCYDPSAISADMLHMAAKTLEAQLGTSAVKKTPSRLFLSRLYGGKKGELRLLTLTFLLMAASPSLGKRAHVYACGLFLALSAKHIYDRRMRLL